MRAQIFATGASFERDDALQARDGRADESGLTEPRPFSHDSHFSVSPDSAHGYRFQAIGNIVVIGANGQIVAVEEPQFAFGSRRRPGVLAVPVATLAKPNDARFLWGPSHTVLGLSADPGPFGDGGAMDEHAKFKALHQEVLQGVGDIALQAFLRFLDRETTPAASPFQTIVEDPRRKLAFRFQYDEHYLYERHAAQLAWRRFLAGRSLCAD